MATRPNLLGKEVIGTGVQAAFLEGWQSVQTLHKYLKTSKVTTANLSQSRGGNGALG